jgi:hypothetical protein
LKNLASENKELFEAKIQISGVFYSLNARGHRERPTRDLLAFAEPQLGRDAMERVYRCP